MSEMTSTTPSAEAGRGSALLKLAVAIAALVALVLLGRAVGGYVPRFAEWVEGLGVLGPIVFVVISRYHGGAFVVFSRRLSDTMEVAALEGTFASVIGGAPSARSRTRSST